MPLHSCKYLSLHFKALFQFGAKLTVYNVLHIKTEHCTYKALILEYSHPYTVSCKYLFKNDIILCVTSVQHLSGQGNGDSHW